MQDNCEGKLLKAAINYRVSDMTVYVHPAGESLFASLAYIFVLHKCMNLMALTINRYSQAREEEDVEDNLDSKGVGEKSRGMK